MSPPTSRLTSVLSHIDPSSTASAVAFTHNHHIHQLSPTLFLRRAAQIEPDAEAIFHVTADNQILRRSYIEFADRARGIAYYLLKHNLCRVGILAPNTPAFLESIFGIGASGGINVAVNYRLKKEDITYILDFAKVDSVIVDVEYISLLDDFKTLHPNIPIIIDTDQNAPSGPFDAAVLEGLRWDEENGDNGWDALKASCKDEGATIAIPFTSGTTAKPKGVVYTHRGVYLAALGNVIESGLNYHVGRCGYLWTLPMFHAMGWSKSFL